LTSYTLLLVNNVVFNVSERERERERKKKNCEEEKKTNEIFF